MEPEPPKFREEVSAIVKVIAGRPFDISCESLNGKPEAQINWALFTQRGSVKEWIWLGNETFSKKAEGICCKCLLLSQLPIFSF